MKAGPAEFSGCKCCWFPLYPVFRSLSLSPSLYSFAAFPVSFASVLSRTSVVVFICSFPCPRFVRIHDTSPWFCFSLTSPLQCSAHAFCPASVLLSFFMFLLILSRLLPSPPHSLLSLPLFLPLSPFPLPLFVSLYP